MVSLGYAERLHLTECIPDRKVLGTELKIWYTLRGVSMFRLV